MLCVFLELKVGHCGPRWISVPLLMNLSRCFPTLLQVEFSKLRLLALRSAIKYAGLFSEANQWRSGKGKYGLLGGR